MAKTRTLQVTIAGDASHLNRAFATAGKEADKFEKRTETMGKKFSGSMKVAGAAAAGALVVGLKESVSAAVEAEKSQARLQAQLKASGVSYKAHSAEIEKSIAATSKLSGLDDEDLQDSFTNLVRVTGDVTKSLELNTLAADLARAKHIDVAKAGELVGKVAGGNVNALKRYGVSVKEGATVQEALAAAQKTFGGQAEAYGKTTAGAADRAKVGFEGLQEVVGARLTPILAKAANKLADLANWASANPGAFKAMALAIGGVAAALGTLSVIGKVAAAFKTLRSVVIGVNAVMLANPAVAVVAGLVALGVALVVAYKKSETFRNIVNGVFSAVKSVALGALRLIVGGLDKLLGVWSSMLGALGHVPGFGWAKRAAKAIDGARESLREFVKGLDEIPRVKNLKVIVGAQISPQLRDLIDSAGTRLVNPLKPTRGATGGMVPGSGRGDKVPALLEPGEFVMQRKVVERFGPTYFAKLNDGQVPQRFMSGGQVASLAKGAGFSGNALITALAIAKGESGWREGASNRNTDGSVDRGLWQINSVHGGLSTFDPAANARAAYKISGGGRNWSPWVVFQQRPASPVHG